MNKYGAWTQNYYLTTPRIGGDGGRIQYAVASIQKELNYNGFKPETCINGTFDNPTRAAVIEFQKSMKLKSDGVVGPETSRALCQRRIYDYSNLRSVNPRITAGIIRVESAYDIGAVGFVNHGRRGLGQINYAFYPNIPDAQAFRASFSIRWVVEYMRMALRDFQDDECAIASYTLGLRGAMDWCRNKGSNVAATAYVANVLEGA